MPGPQDSTAKQDRLLPRSLPQRIVALDAGGTAHHFRWRAGRLGRIRVTQQSSFTPFAAGQACVAVIDPQLLFRRSSQSAPQNRAELLRLAQDFFPFSSDAARYAYLPGHLYALTEEKWAALQKSFPARTVAIVPSAANASSIEAALEARMEYGTLGDLQSPPQRFLPPAHKVTLTLGGLLLFFALSFWPLSRYQQNYQAAALQAELTQLQQEIGPVQKRAEANEIMQNSLQQADKLAAEPGAAMIATLSRALSAMPDGISMDRIEYKAGALTVSGLGKNAEKWLGQSGAGAADIQITPMPQLDRYQANLPLVTP